MSANGSPHPVHNILVPHEEAWAAIPGREGQYEVSTRGRVRGLCRELVNRNGIVRRWRGQMMKLSPNQSGYPCVSLGGDTSSVHVLVLRIFVGPCPEGQECRHLDGNRKNNNLENLAWGTPSENSIDSVRHGTHPNGFAMQTPEFRRKLAAKNGATHWARLTAEERSELGRKLAVACQSKKTPEERSALGRKAAAARWAKHRALLTAGLLPPLAHEPHEADVTF